MKKNMLLKLLALVVIVFIVILLVNLYGCMVSGSKNKGPFFL